jgi:hypothetical protein
MCVCVCVTYIIVCLCVSVLARVSGGSLKGGWVAGYTPVVTVKRVAVTVHGVVDVARALVKTE